MPRQSRPPARRWRRNSPHLREGITQCEQFQEALSGRLSRREITLDAFDRANQPLAEDLARLRTRRDELPGGEPGSPLRV